MSIPDDGFDISTEHVFGDPEAPVTVVEYGDFECPYCAAAAPVLRELVEDSGGRVRLIFRNFPLPEVHPHALTAALAAEAAGAQGAYWRMHDLLFTKQDRLDDRSLKAYADHLGLDGNLVVGAAARARTAGSTQGRGGSVSGPSVPGEHSGKRSPRNRSRTTPTTAAVTDPARMPIVACSLSCSSSNARSAMNSEIVKPMPASTAPPSRCP